MNIDDPLLSTLMSKDNNDSDMADILQPARPESRYNQLNLPLPPSREQILIDVEQIKQRFKQQEEQWNFMLSRSRTDADERLNNILITHEKTQFYK